MGWRGVQDVLEVQISGHQPTLLINNLCSQDYLYFGHYTVPNYKDYTKERLDLFLPSTKLKSTMGGRCLKICEINK